jgi:hypothetical protein
MVERVGLISTILFLVGSIQLWKYCVFIVIAISSAALERKTFFESKLRNHGNGACIVFELRDKDMRDKEWNKGYGSNSIFFLIEMVGAIAMILKDYFY